MNLLDIVLILLFIPGIIRGLRKGILEQGITLLGIFLAVWLAFKYHVAVAARIRQLATLDASDTLINVLSFAGIIFVVLLVVMLLTALITHLVEMAAMGWLNRVLGMFFAILTTALVLGIFIILFDTINAKFQLTGSSVMNESLLYGYLRDLGYFAFPYLKQLFTMGA